MHRDDRMNASVPRLRRLIRSVHCIGTHQRFALDALTLVNSEAGQRLSAWLIRYYRAYLRGTLDPDERFRDFHNHMLLVDDGYWGGAPRVAHQWYGRLQTYLRREQFRQAAHAAGVLSHYVTDVVQPLHTISSDRESLVHLPLEHSIECRYETIMHRWRRDGARFVIRLSREPAWLGSLMMHTGQYARQYADSLARDYSFSEGIRDAERGLTPSCIGPLSDLFGLAITSWARVLERAASDAESSTDHLIPAPRLLPTTVSAVVTAPISIWKKTLRRKLQRVVVETLADEYFHTGRLAEQLPAEIDIKRRVIEIRNHETRIRSRQRNAA
jgi:hypothetical protein